MMVLGRTKHNLKLIKKLVFVLILFAFGFMLNTNTVKADPTKEAYFKDGTSIDNFFKIRTTYKKGFRKATAEEWAARGNKGWVLSTDDSPYPIYVWDLDTDWVYGSEADIIYLNPDSSNMLSMTNFNSIDLSGVDTSKVINMQNMFAFSAYVRTLDISNFNTSNVTNMSGMFQDFGVYNLDLRNFNTSKVTDMSYMFKNQYSYLKSVDLSSFDTSKVTDMSYMFMSCDSVTSLNLSNFYTPEVTNMKNMFSGMRELESLDISNFSTSKVTDMSSMFSGIKKLKTLDIRNFNTSNVTDMSGMFSGMSDLESLDVSNFNTSKVTDMSYMFREMDGITSLDLGSFDTSKVTNMKYMFQGSNYLRNINLSSFDTRNVTDMQYMFELCNDLRTIDVSSFKVYNVENMDRMFSYTYNLESVDLSSFDISKVTNMSHMFYTSAVREIDFGSFDTRQVTNMENIFGGSSLRTVYVSELFNTDNIPADQVLFLSTESLVGQNGTAYNSANKTKEYAVIDDPDNGHPGYLTYTEYRPKIHYPDGTVEEVRLYDTFTMPEGYPLNSLPLATVTLNLNYDGADSKYSYVEKQFVFNKWVVKDTEYDPGDTLVVTYDVYLEPDYIEVTGGADLSPARRSGYKFLGWYTEPEGGELVESYDTEEDITLYAHWGDAQFAYLIEGSTINGKFDKTNTTEFRRATLEEYNAANLTSDNIISTEDSPNVVYMWNTTIDSKVVTLYYTEADFMYMNADSSAMFGGLKNITELDLSDFITSNVTNMSFMFGYIGVTSLDLSTFDTSNVTKMNEMFFNSANLQELNVSSFDTSNVTTMVSMFNDCPSLQELDLSSFDTSNVRLMGSMFAYCDKLTTIYASNKWSTSGLNYNANQDTMFVGDGRIMGYLGSKYDFYWHGADKARIDGGPGNEGYLTDISHKGETHTVTFPDNSVKTYNHNSIVYLDTNETSLGEYTSGEITFKYHNGNIDTTSNQLFEMAGDGFTCDDTHYRDNGEVRVNADKVIEYAYKPVITNSVFPEDPEKDGYIFMGWFTEEEGGEKYTEYTGDEPIVLHAQYGLPISYLISGSDINNKITYFTDYSSINEFRRGTLEEYNQAKDSFNDDYNIISTDESPLPTYMWYDGSNVLYYSDAENIYMNADSASMFSYTYASSIDVTEFDTSNVTDMSYMFSSGEMTELDLSHFNTSNVTNMAGMFQSCSSLQTIYVSNKWSTDSLEDGNGQYMFDYDENLVGSSGTTYDENHTDDEYARPDEGASNPGYFTLVTFYNVTYPNSSTRSYKDGTVINLGENDSPAIVVTAGTITFKYHDDETEDTTLTKITTKTPNGFKVNGNHIDDNEDITINEDKVIEYDYDEEVTGDEFPEPTKENAEFLGWYTEEIDGEKVESYDGEEGITLHAHWKIDMVTVTSPIETVEVPKGSTYTIPWNNIPKESELSIRVTFVLQNGEEDIVREGYKEYTPNGWYIGDVEYAGNEEITVNEDIELVPKYETTYGKFKYQGDPTYSIGTFKEWNTEPDGTGEVFDPANIYLIEDGSDLTYYAIWDVEEVTIHFISNGGTHFDDITKYKNAEMGELPEPTKDGYIFDGWYKEDSLQNKVSIRTIVTGDMTLYANYIYEPFPYVYELHEDPFVCTGTTYINTGVQLYKDTTWAKDYEIGFTIEEYDPDNQPHMQSVFMNTKYENEAVKWPGLVVRKSSGKIEITQTINYANGNYGNKVQKSENLKPMPMKITIYRINKIVYYSVNDGDMVLVQNMKDFNQYFETPVYFCAGDDGNGGAQRFLKGTISNYYVRTGNYQDISYSVTYPDNTVESYEYNSIIDLEPNDSYKDSEDVGTITFNPHNEDSETVSVITKNYIPNGYIINGVHYDNEATLIVNENKVITYDYSEETSVEFPEDPYKEGYIFDGWYTEEEGGEKIENYEGTGDMILHAHYIPEASRVLESNTYTVKDDTLDEQDYRIIIGAEVGTTIGEFKDNLENPNEYIKIYDGDTEVSDDDIVKTGLIIKLEINGTVYDEAIMIVRGDIDGDGYVDITDKSLLADHILMINEITGNNYFAADIDGDGYIDITDKSKVADYILMISDSLNK